MKVAIVNYGAGNLGSVRRAFEDLGVESMIAGDPSALYEADRLVLPGVGAFAEAMALLRTGGWVEALNDNVLTRGKPLLGICLGMHLLATTGIEGGETKGLDFLPGQVRRLDDLGCKLRIPHVGWNEVTATKDDVLLKDIPDASDFYFVHSFAFSPESHEYLVAIAPYGISVAAIVRNRHVFGCQFHPEKSSKAGRRILKNFMEYVPC